MTKRTHTGNPIIWMATVLASATAIALAVFSVPDPTLESSSNLPRADGQQTATPDLRVATPTSPPSATIVPSPIPTATSAPDFVYTVQPSDTLWDIARRFDVTVDFIVNANPDLNSVELLHTGDEILIPGVDIDPGTIPDPEWPITGQVTADAEGLRLRTKPSLDGEILYSLPALTPLTIVGKTEDEEWLTVRTPYLDGGWAKSDWIEVFIDLEEVPVTWYSAEVSQGGQPGGGGATPVPGAMPESYAFVSGVSEDLREIYRLGLSMGNRSNVFSKVGDSITVNISFMTPFGTHSYALYDHTYLQSVVDYYSASWARTHNSFANVSLAAGVGWTSWRVITAGEGDPGFCNADETPLECEYRWLRPSVAIIMLGTNDVPGTEPRSFDYPLREIIETSLENGVIPVLTTIPPLHGYDVSARVLAYNRVVAALSGEYGVPMIDYWAAVQGLPNDGLSSDGVHPSSAPGGDNGYLSSGNLRYGCPMRNLVTLQALDLILRDIIEAE